MWSGLYLKRSSTFIRNYRQDSMRLYIGITMPFWKHAQIGLVWPFCFRPSNLSLECHVTSDKTSFFRVVSSWFDQSNNNKSRTSWRFQYSNVPLMIFLQIIWHCVAIHLMHLYIFLNIARWWIARLCLSRNINWYQIFHFHGISSIMK